MLEFLLQQFYHVAAQCRSDCFPWEGTHYFPWQHNGWKVKPIFSRYAKTSGWKCGKEWDFLNTISNSLFIITYLSQRRKQQCKNLVNWVIRVNSTSDGTSWQCVHCEEQHFCGVYSQRRSWFKSRGNLRQLRMKDFPQNNWPVCLQSIKVKKHKQRPRIYPV